MQASGPLCCSGNAKDTYDELLWKQTDRDVTVKHPMALKDFNLLCSIRQPMNIAFGIINSRSLISRAFYQYVIHVLSQAEQGWGCLQHCIYTSKIMRSSRGYVFENLLQTQ